MEKPLVKQVPGPRNSYDTNSIIKMLADILAPNDARPPAGVVPTTKSGIFLESLVPLSIITKCILLIKEYIQNGQQYQ